MHYSEQFVWSNVLNFHKGVLHEIEAGHSGESPLITLRRDGLIKLTLVSIVWLSRKVCVKRRIPIKTAQMYLETIFVVNVGWNGRLQHMQLNTADLRVRNRTFPKKNRKEADYLRISCVMEMGLRFWTIASFRLKILLFIHCLINFLIVCSCL